MTETVGIDIELNSEPARRGSREYEAALRSVAETSRRANEEFERTDRVLGEVGRNLTGSVSGGERLDRSLGKVGGTSDWVREQMERMRLPEER